MSTTTPRTSTPCTVTSAAWRSTCVAPHGPSTQRTVSISARRGALFACKAAPLRTRVKSSRPFDRPLFFFFRSTVSTASLAMRRGLRVLRAPHPMDWARERPTCLRCLCLLRLITLHDEARTLLMCVVCRSGPLHISLRSRRRTSSATALPFKMMRIDLSSSEQQKKKARPKTKRDFHDEREWHAHTTGPAVLTNTPTAGGSVLRPHRGGGVKQRAGGVGERWPTTATPRMWGGSFWGRCRT